MDSLLELMKEKALLIMDGESGYTQEDFDREFNTGGYINSDYPVGYDKITLGVVNTSGNPLPEYKTSGASGFDIAAYLDKPVTLKPLERRLIPTGLQFDIPENMEVTIRPRSGLALKNGITVLNSPGTLDFDYTGMCGVILINLGSEDFTINNGDRIAQGVLASVLSKTFVDIKNITEINKTTNRNSAGFGTTG